ncbi:MAG TPA: Nif3-like dinuclear metal center hexameric protein [Chthoniobacteraceae bacterium]|nr:Nif3-like dinuclear metal center hexameric protein [Chthoniobacteraceae bacterium]
MADVSNLTGYLDRYLKIKTIADWPNAYNGLQVANGGRARRIGAAVDACEAVLREAVERGVDFLLVHHGLFWSGVQPLTGAYRRKIKLALDGGLAIYSAHLPLDVHPAVGNNALFCKALGFKKTTPFFFQKNQYLGLQTEHPINRDALVRRAEEALGSRVHLCPGGPRKARRIGVVTGGAGSEIFRAAGEGIDTFITGEGPHWSYTAAEELGVNVIYGGHYATETFGVKALAAHLSRHYKLPWEFIDHPTGL